MTIATPLLSAMPIALAARLAGRPFWAVRYRDGTVITELERDWLDLPRKGRMALRLYCPDGRHANVGNSKDATDRLFQFKTASVGAPVNGPTRGPTRATHAYVIGIIHGTDGQCTLWAWEAADGRLVGPLEDNANAMRYANVGALHGPHLGIKAD